MGNQCGFELRNFPPSLSTSCAYFHYWILKMEGYFRKNAIKALSSFNLSKANAQNRGTLSVVSSNVSRHESTVNFDFQYYLFANVEN